MLHLLPHASLVVFLVEDIGTIAPDFPWNVVREEVGDPSRRSTGVLSLDGHVSDIVHPVLGKPVRRQV